MSTRLASSSLATCALATCALALALAGCPASPPCAPNTRLEATTVPGMAAPAARILRLGLLDEAQPLVMGSDAVRKLELELDSPDELAILVGGEPRAGIDELARAAPGTALASGATLVGRGSGKWRQVLDDAVAGGVFVVRVDADRHGDVRARIVADVANPVGGACGGAPALLPRVRFSAASGVCGDGRVEGDEFCDDGNAAAVDGCVGCLEQALTCDDATALTFTNWVCRGEPSACQAVKGCDPAALGEGCWGGEVMVATLLDGRYAPAQRLPSIRSRLAEGAAPASVPALACSSIVAVNRVAVEGTCRGSFGPCREVELVAEAAPGTRFARWMGACAGDGKCVVKPDRDRRALAVFDAEDDGLAWAAAFEGPEIEARRVAVGAEGVRVAGSFRGSIATGSHTLRDTSGGMKGFLLALDPSGKPRWSQAVFAAELALAADGTTVLFTGHEGHELRRLDRDGTLLEKTVLASAEQVFFEPGGTALVATTPEGVRVLELVGAAKGRWSMAVAPTPAKAIAIARSGARTGVLLETMGKVRAAELAADGTIAWGRELPVARPAGEALRDRLAIGFSAAGELLVVGPFADAEHMSHERLRLFAFTPAGELLRDVPLGPTEAKSQVDPLRSLALGASVHPAGAAILVAHDVGTTDTRTAGITVSALDPAGTLRWTERHGPRALGAVMLPDAIATSVSGASVVVGHYRGAIDLGSVRLGRSAGLFVLRLEE